MDQQPQTEQSAWRQRETRESCTGCGEEAVMDPAESGLNCATCGQWFALCDDCMPKVSEHSRDAAWLCPECRDPTYH
jgi:predicted RNA-binding Zn-ribbon protein involved in translation (DUF1610 family)